MATIPPCRQPEYISEYNKKWYAKNKDKHLAYCTEKVKCKGCGRNVCRASYLRHLKSKYHMKRTK